MSANNGTNIPGRAVHSSPVSNAEPPPPVYTVYSEPGHGNVNYGFHASHPQAPPPKYEDVISGKPIGQPTYYLPPPPGLYQHESIPTRVIVVPDPAYKYTKLHKTIGLVFLIIFLASFISIMVKIFGSMRH